VSAGEKKGVESVLPIERQDNVSEKILELCQSVYEGLLHLQNRTARGKFQETAYLLEDTVLACNSIGRALLQNYLVDSPGLVDAFGRMDEILAALLESCRWECQELARMQVDDELLPAFYNWYREIERFLKAECALLPGRAAC